MNPYTNMSSVQDGKEVPSRRQYIKEDKWKCVKCENPDLYARNQQKTNERNENPGRVGRGKCPMSQNCLKFRAGDGFFTCTRCDKDIHLKPECSGVSREARKTLDLSSWICPGCNQKEAERQARINAPRVEVNRVEYVLKGKLNKSVMRVLQWNADSFSTKKEEFQATIKKHKVDIFLIQETKMTKNALVPVIPGYTIVNKPSPSVK